MTVCRTDDRRLGHLVPILRAILLMVPISGLVSGCLWHKKVNTMLAIRYFPFDAETLRPVTAETILSRGGECLLSDPQDAKRLTEIIGSAAPSNEPFLAKLVRVRVDRATPGSPSALVAIIDRQGNVQAGTPVGTRLSPEKLAELRILIDKCFASQR